MHSWRRFVKGSKKMALEFLGEKLFPRSPFYLAMKFNVPVSFVFAMKENKHHYHFMLPLLNFISTGDPAKKGSDHKAHTKRVYLQLEKMIRKYPSQWFIITTSGTRWAIKIILVSANRFTSPYPVYPLGIAYIKAYLNETMPSLKVEIFDFMTGSLMIILNCFQNLNLITREFPCEI